jgi:AcrR family transcriptional regulator
MASEEKRLRADAERNRRRLLDAAQDLFCQRGLEVGVGEIAEHAGVGRGTLFRNFPSKEHLIAAIVVERMNDGVARGRELLDAEDPGQALFEFIDEIVGRQQLDRALFEAVADTFLANPDIRAAYGELVGVLEELVGRAQEAGAVRVDIGAVDILMLTKGVCQAASAFAQVDPGIAERQLDLVRSALTPQGPATALRGKTLSLDDLERAYPAPPAPASSEPAAARRGRSVRA